MLATLIERMMAAEVVPTLDVPGGVDLAAYCAQLLARFRNPALPHRTRQIAMDGSQSSAAPARDGARPDQDARIDRASRAGDRRVDHYASGTDEHGKAIVVADPLSARFAAIASAARGNASQIADAFLDLTAVFGDDLSNDPAFRRAVARDVGGLMRDGVRRTLAVHIAPRGAQR
jgi:fructuronate reductase